MFLANAEGGTVEMIDARTFEILRTYDVLPDEREADPSEDDPFHALLGQAIVEAVGGDNYAQDQDVSPDGRTFYVSRGHRGDVAAFDVATGEMIWKVPISGFRADHMTISKDGRHLFVSAMTDNHVEVVDTEAGEIVGSFETGEWPHDNKISSDGERIYNASIGAVIIDEEIRESRPVTAHPVLPEEYVLTVADVDTLEILRTYEFDAGVRPFAITADERWMYAQLSEYHGVIEFDLESGKITRELDLPIREGFSEDDYEFDAPHHGLAMSPDEELLCLAGRASDYVAIVEIGSFEAAAIIDVGDGPSWATNSPDGDLCFVANTYDNTLSVVSYGLRDEVARIDVGDGPKHLAAARVPLDVLGEEDAAAAQEVDDDDTRTLPATGPTTVLPLALIALFLGLAARRHGRPEVNRIS